MTEQLNLENIVFETARKYHENYLLKSQEQDLQDAIESYVEVLSLNPEKAECYYRLANLMYESGQITLESTIEQCKKAISMNPDNVNAYIYAGYYLEQAENYSEAEKIFKKAIKMSEFKSARARLILASMLNRKIHSQKFNLLNYIQYGYYLITGGITIFADTSAINMLYKSLKDFISFEANKFICSLAQKFSAKTAVSFCKKAISCTKQYEYFTNEMAKVYLANGDIEHTFDCYKKILEYNPNSKTALIKLATLTQLHNPEKTDLIIDYYTMLLEIEEDDLSPIYYELGHLYLQKNDKINAVSAFKLALEGNEDNAYYNDALAYAYVQAELFDDAIEYYQRAIKLNPDRFWTVNVCYSLGLIYQKCKENYEAAIASFQAGAILDPENENVLLALGDVYMLQNDIDSAIKTYEDVINLNKNNADAYSKLGIALWDKHIVSEAIDAYRKALEINPEHSVSYNNLGIIYLEETKDYNTAIEFFDEALRLNPSYTLAYFNKGRALQKLENYNEAAKHYQMAIDLNKITGVLDENILQEKLHSLFNF